MTPDAREKYLEDMKDHAEKRPKIMRWAFPTRYDRYGDSMQYLDKVQSVEKQIGDISRYMNKATILDTTEEQNLRTAVIGGVASMRLQEREGRNFAFSKENQARIEKLYNDLYTTILGGIQRLESQTDPVATYNALIKSEVSTRATKIKNDTEYNKDKAKMESMRTKLGILAGTKAAGIYLGTAWMVGQIAQ